MRFEEKLQFTLLKKLKKKLLQLSVTKLIKLSNSRSKSEPVGVFAVWQQVINCLRFHCSAHLSLVAKGPESRALAVESKSQVSILPLLVSGFISPKRLAGGYES